MSYQPECYWNDLLTGEQDARKVCYPDWPLSYNRFLHEQQLHTWNSIAARLGMDQPERTVVEVGPGSGFWTDWFMTRHPKQYTGIELSREAAANLQQRWPDARIIHANAGLLPAGALPEASADLVFAAMVFLHITDDELLRSAILNLGACLKPGGHAVILDAIATHRVFGPDLKQYEGPDFDPSFHNKIRSLGTFRQLAGEAGLAVEAWLPAFNTSQACFDFRTPIEHLIFGRLAGALHRRILHHAPESRGKWYAAVQRIIDGFLTRTLGLGMSSKWLILKK